MAEPTPPSPEPDSDATISQSPPAAAPLPAIQIDGYRLQHEISRGGQAVVYSAQFLKTGRRVAVKIMREGPLATENGRARFTREAQILASLNHPNIVTILDRGRTADGSEFFTMDYISGQALDEGAWKQHGYMDKVNDNPAMPLQLFLKICDAVNAAHLRGIVHRDLKPSNIRLDERGEPHVLDFGLARGGISGDSQSSTEPVTITGQFLGSLPWASPEQAEGIGQKIDMRSDVYSLGVILYQLVTGGHFPYQVVGSMRDILNNIMTAEPPAPSVIMAERESRDLARRARRSGPPAKLLNPALDAIILRALAKRRDDRYQSAGELARDIEAYLSGRPLAAGMQTAPVARSRTPMLAGIGVAALAVIGISVFATYMLTRDKTATPGPVTGTPPETKPTATLVAVPPATLPVTTAPQMVATQPAPAVPAGPLHPLVAASPLKAEYQELEVILNRFMIITDYINTNGPIRIGTWRAAAERGDPVGQMLLGRCYEFGAGVTRNGAEGDRLIRQAAAQGLPMAQCLLGIRFRAAAPPTRDYPEALKWYAQAAEGGSARAMIDLGIMNMQGQGTAVDYPTAVRWLRQAADLGAPAAFDYLGDIYRFGDGVPADVTQAVTYYKQAADGGVAQAMVSLGQLSINGRGVPQDYAQAMAWFKKADPETLGPAAYGIAEMYANGQGVPQDYAMAAQWYQKATTSNMLAAMRKLGTLYEQGNGVAKDHAQAVALYTKAANLGDAESKQWLADHAAP